jgi:murein DD-endopeptidase MepM/ murein hydrolase activator NlpD
MPALFKLRLIRWLIGLLVTVILGGLLVVAGIAMLIVVVISHPPAAAADGPAGVVSALGWSNPAVGPISSPFGKRLSPCAGCSSFHDGDDIAASCGSSIRAARAGTVTMARVYGGYGNFIMISHGAGLFTAYGHIVDGGTKVSVGESVSAGEVIALVGSTGHSTGCHLHFEIRVGGTQVDPLPIMTAGGIRLGVN